jgi:antirestriction protein ArdC
MSKQVGKGKGTMGTNAYEVVAQTIIKQLEEGTAPWRKPWVANGYTPLSLSSKKAYRGANYWLLSFAAMGAGYNSPWWGTFKQIKEMGGTVRKGEKGTPVVLWREVESETAEGELKKAVLLRYFTVFNAEQADWEEEAPAYDKPAVREKAEVCLNASAVVSGYLGADNSPTLATGGDRAYYRPSTDHINVPKQNSFLLEEEYYATLFHEFAHSTGHKDRLNREGVVEGHRFGDELYSEEELIAEFTSAFLCSHTGIAPITLDNSASYIASWHRALKNDPKVLIKAISKAQKASDYILGVE